MLLSIKNLSKYKIEATDGNIGHVHSFLFDDQSWAVRYLVVDTGNWLPDRKVLIPPSALGEPAGRVEAFPVKLTREQIKGSPDIDTDKPVVMDFRIEREENVSPMVAAGAPIYEIIELESRGSDKEKIEQSEKQSEETVSATVA